MREKRVHKKTWLRQMISLALTLMLVLGAFGNSVFCVSAAAEADAKTVYLDGTDGNDNQDGQTEETAVATFSKAKELVGAAGTIYVCGTVNVSNTQSWSLGQGVTLERNYGFNGAIANVSGSLTLSGIELHQSDVSGNGTVEGIAGRAAAADICVPSQVTLVQPKALSEVSLTELCVGNGTFAWADGSFVPDKYETKAQIIFTPSDMDRYDYSGLSGWNGGSCTIVRSVTVLTQSFLEPEPEEEEPADEPDQKEDQASDTAETEENSGEDKDTASEDAAGQENEDAADPSGEEKTDEADKTAADGSTDEADKTAADGSTDDADQPAAGDKADETDQSAAADKTDEAKEPSSGENADQTADEEAAGGDKTTDQPAGDEAAEQDAPAADNETGDGTKEEVSAYKEAEALLKNLPKQIKNREDVDAVVKASIAYESLSDGEKGKISSELTDAMYEGQTASLAINRTSLGVTVIGDLPWYIQFRAEVISGERVDDSTIRTLLESYEFKLWNLITDKEYRLDGQSVTILMAAPAEQDGEIVIYHYLSDGTVEQIIPEITGDQMRFATSSFSPFSVVSMNVAGSTELVGTTGFSYMGGSSNKPSSGSSGGSSGGTTSGNSGGSSGKTNSEKTTLESSGGSSGKTTSGSKNGSSGITKISVSGSGKSTSSSKTSSVVTGDNANVIGYSMVSVGSMLLLLFAGYMVYVQKKRKAWVRK